jgi:DNA-binding beta-propeller fold protein YncE
MVFAGNSVSGGISAFRLNSDGSLTPAPDGPGGSFAGPTGSFTASALAKSGSLLIAGKENQVGLYAIDAQTGNLVLLGTASIASPPTAKVPSGITSATASGNFVYVGTANGIYAFSIANRTLAPMDASSLQQNQFDQKPSQQNPFDKNATADGLQRTAYTHLLQQGAMVVGAHGANTVVQTLQVGGSGVLTPKGNSQSSGSFAGMAIAPSGRWVYGSIDGKIISVPINSSAGTFGALVKSGAGNAAQGNFAGRIAVSPSGGFLYQADQHLPVINVYSIDQQTGHMAFASQISSQGLGTGIAVDPSGRFVVVTSGDGSGEHISVFKVNAANGALTAIPGSHDVGAKSPTDIVIADF